MEIDVTDLSNYQALAMMVYAIQDAMPNLTPDEREFIKTGITPKEWDEMFGDAGDE